MGERFLLVDSNSLIYRGFFAVPPLTTTKGELANATFGFASILLKSLEQATPQHIAAAFDLPVPTFRREMEPTYKATRKPMPDELRPQFERCKQLLEAFGIPSRERQERIFKAVRPRLMARVTRLIGQGASSSGTGTTPL